MTFTIEIVLRERDYAVTDEIESSRIPSDWNESDVEQVLKAMLLAIDRAKNPGEHDRYVALRGFSWIVEPTAGGVVIAIEIPSGAVVAGPFDIERARLDRLITRVLQSAANDRPVVH